MTHLSRVVLFSLFIALAGCASSTGTQTAGFSSTSDTAVDAVSMTDASATGTVARSVPVMGTGGPTAGEYRISAQDLIEISVFRVPDLSKTVQVSANGLIALPLIGEVSAGGRTVAELETEIATKLQRDYIQNPDVSVFVKESANQRVTVEGAVAKPGIYQTNGSTTLMQVVAQAGGLQRIADPRGILIFRYVDGKRQAAKFDFEAVRKGTSDDPLILGGDVVVVDQSGIKAAMQNVRESISFFGLFTPLI